MAYNTEKEAKLKALKSINSSAKEAMSRNLKKKDSPELKKHVKEMSDDALHDFKDDSDHITDPQMSGNVIGRHISDENEDCGPEDGMSVYDIDERLAKLMAHKKAMGK